MKPVAALMVLSLLSGCAGWPSFPAWDEAKPLKLVPVQTFDYEFTPWQFEFGSGGDIWVLGEKLTKMGAEGQVLVAIDNAFITGLGVDSQGNCWVGNQGNLLTKFASDGRELWRKNFELGDWAHLPVSVRRDDSLWINAEKLEKLSSSGEPLGEVAIPELKGHFFQAIVETPSGEVWLAGAGLRKLSADGKSVSSFLPESNIAAAVGDRDGNLWITHVLDDPTWQKGSPAWCEVLKVSPQGNVTITLMREGGYFGLAVDRQNNLWLRHSTDFRYDAPTLEKFSPSGRSLGKVTFDAPIIGMAVDPSGLLWIGQKVSDDTPSGRVTKYQIE
jgi:sugar lactone lactonase YvrE